MGTVRTKNFIDARHPHFATLFAGAPPEQLASGCKWAEGPAYLAQQRCVVWSDIPNDRMLRWDEVTGGVSIYRSPARYTNGHTLDHEGRLISCEHGSRSVTRLEHDGSTTVLASHWQGKRLNSPNDVVVARDGAIWFTDPAYGIDSDYEGHKADSEIGACHVYRVDPASGTCETVLTDFARPNGLAFNADESLLYVADTGRTHVADGPKHIRVFTVGAGYALSGGALFANCDVGLFDGFRVDALGRVWTSAGDGVHCYAPSGALLGKVLLPEPAANLVFGGVGGSDLFVCATSALYRVRLASDWATSSASMNMAATSKPV
ncbi:SMP-30/gluconolactonase/LRE family protein [Rhodoferax saidenbachensis]|uniref:Gluconolactonase n=1 Tax=Rhodoferax saidenbachensis TaxID=1484693 RepID=A0ABU1ZMU8_9BURK|nr:gluconolactonase [Rhodoferax saidenbachensis]